MSGQRTSSAPAHLSKIWLQARDSLSGTPCDIAALILTHMRSVLLNTIWAGTSQATVLPPAAGVERICCRGSVKQGCPCCGSTAQEHGDASVASLLSSYSRPSFICRNSKVFQLSFSSKAHTAGLDVLL